MPQNIPQPNTKLNDTIKRVTDRIIERSQPTRETYLKNMQAAKQKGVARGQLSCSGLAHACAAMGDDKDNLAQMKSGNLAIVSAYNDMLSAHQPFARFPDLIKDAVRDIGGTAQFAGGVPAMCDGVTQGEAGMELSLFSRDVIALSASVALSHQTFDAAVFLGVCDKIVPGLVIAAQIFGHLPIIFLPAGPMVSGLANDEKAKIRQKFATGDIDRQALLKAEMEAYHAPGTCTFYGTANTNQMLMEFMGLHLAGASFVTPNTDLRDALTQAGAKRALQLSALGDNYTPICDILDERAFVNGMVGLNATGGSTNLLIHLIAMAAAGGIILDLQDFSDISDVTPLLTRIYPNGIADVNHFHAAGGLGFVIAELLQAGLLHDNTQTVAGQGLAHYTQEPYYIDDKLAWRAGNKTSLNHDIIRPYSDPFQANGGLKKLNGNLGTAIVKISAVAPQYHQITAPVRVFNNQHDVKKAFQAGELVDDVIIVVRFQGPKANGMPELHSLTPLLSAMQSAGQKVALVTDGRMSGASGKVLCAIHVSLEAVEGGAIAKLQDGDMLQIDAKNGVIEIITDNVLKREAVSANLDGNQTGTGRELFKIFRDNVSDVTKGASIF